MICRVGLFCIHGDREEEELSRHHLHRRPAERAAGRPPPHHPLLTQGPTDGSDERALQEVEASLALRAMPRHRPERVRGRQ